MSRVDLEAIRKRYTPIETPNCRICGEPMGVQSIGPDGVTFGCDPVLRYEGEKAVYKEGREYIDQHYSDSRRHYHRTGDSDVIALITELEQTRSQLAAAEERERALERSSETWQRKVNECWERLSALVVEGEPNTLDYLLDKAVREKSRAEKAERARDRLIERSRQLSQARRDRDHWCRDALTQTTRAETAEALAERYRVAGERMGQELHDALLHHKAGGTNTFRRCEVEPCKSWRTALQQQPATGENDTYRCSICGLRVNRSELPHKDYPEQCYRCTNLMPNFKQGKGEAE